jgi:hypothetical protein
VIGLTTAAVLTFTGKEERGEAMATLFKEIEIDASPEAIWSAAKDLGALHTKLVPGFVVDTKMAGDRTRDVTFGNGLKVREHILSLDDNRRRLAWTIESDMTQHYNAVLEVAPLVGDQKTSRVRWTTDLLPDNAKDQISTMQDQGLAAMKQAFETKR